MRWSLQTSWGRATCWQFFKLSAFNPYAAGGYFGQHKMILKNLKMTETLLYGYSYESTQREQSNEYQYDRV